jgi:hypothetical protein
MPHWDKYLIFCSTVFCSVPFFLNVCTFVDLCVRLKPEVDGRNAGIEGENGVIGSGAQDPDPVLDAKDGRRLVLVVLDKEVVEAARLVLRVFHVLYRVQEHVLNKVFFKGIVSRDDYFF